MHIHQIEKILVLLDSVGFLNLWITKIKSELNFLSAKKDRFQKILWGIHQSSAVVGVEKGKHEIEKSISDYQVSLLLLYTFPIY